MVASATKMGSLKATHLRKKGKPGNRKRSVNRTESSEALGLRSQVTFISIPPEPLGLPRLPAVCQGEMVGSRVPRTPQLWAFSSEGLHFLPPQVRPSVDSGFSLQAAPLFVTGGGRGDCGFTWSVGVWEGKNDPKLYPLLDSH